MGGHETLNLYAEAIAKMPENARIRPLFRDSRGLPGPVLDQQTVVGKVGV